MMPARVLFHPYRVIKAQRAAIQAQLRIIDSQTRVSSQLRADLKKAVRELHEAYADGLRQGHADAYYGNLPSCPDCGRNMPWADTSDHNSDCQYGKRG